MAHHQYYVVLHDDQWKVTYDGKRYGPYDTQREAYSDAVEAAKHEGSKGHQAQVFIQGGDNEFRVEWTYGRDPYPPPGLSK